MYTRQNKLAIPSEHVRAWTARQKQRYFNLDKMSNDWYDILITFF